MNTTTHYLDYYGETNFDADLGPACPPAVRDCSECAANCPFELRKRKAAKRIPDVFKQLYRVWGISA